MDDLTPNQNDLFKEIAAKIGERAFWDSPETSEEIETIIREYPEADIRRAMLTMTEPKPWPGNLRKQLGTVRRARAGVPADHLRYLDSTPSPWFLGGSASGKGISGGKRDGAYECSVCGLRYTFEQQEAHWHRPKPKAGDIERFGCIFCVAWFDTREEVKAHTIAEHNRAKAKAW